jgi:hypothetical protein
LRTNADPRKQVEGKKKAREEPGIEENSLWWEMDTIAGRGQGGKVDAIAGRSRVEGRFA